MLSWLINQHATILDEKCWEFCTFVPTERLSCGFGTTMAPPLAPPWSVLFRRAQKISSNVFLEGEGSICSCQCFQELYLQTRRSNVHFSECFFFPKLKHRARSLARTPVWLSRQRRNSRYDICGWSWINQYQHHNLSTTLVDLTKAFYTFSRDGLRKIMSKFGCPPLSSPLLARSF